MLNYISPVFARQSFSQDCLSFYAARDAPVKKCGRDAVTTALSGKRRYSVISMLTQYAARIIPSSSSKSIRMLSQPAARAVTFSWTELPF